MFVAIKLVIYFIAAHIFYSYGFEPTKKLMDFLVLMGCMLMMDVVSYSSAKYAIENENKKDD